MNSKGSSVLFSPSHPADGTAMHWPWTATFDGTNVWVLERDLSRNILGLHQLDLNQGRTRIFLPSADREIAGLAWDGDSSKFWISNFKGRVYAVDRDEAIRGGKLEAGIGRSFPGNYTALTFGRGHLWGLDADRRQICKIKVRD